MADATMSGAPERLRHETGFGFVPARLPTPAALAFGAGSLGPVAFIIAPQLLLLFYATEVLAIPAAWAGLALLLPKAWEFLTDPLVGHWSDRTTHRWGRRRPWMLAGALLLPLAFAALFATPDLADWRWRLAWLTGAFVVATTAYTLFAIPYVALPADLAATPAGRTRVVAFRMSFVSVGILLAGAGAPALVEAEGGGRAAYATMGLAIAALSGAGMLLAFFGARAARVEPGVRDGPPLSAQLAAALRSRPLRVLLAPYVVQMVSNGANAAMLAYAAKYVLGAGEALVGVFFGVFTLASLAATPAFAMLAKRRGKWGTFRQATVVYAAGTAALLLAPWSGEVALLAAGALAGVGNAGTQLMSYALLPDALDAERDATGVERAGVFTGVWVAAEKLALAAGAASAGVTLGAAGFVEGGGAQSDATRAAILALFAAVPAILMAASLLLFPRHSETAP